MNDEFGPLLTSEQLYKQNLRELIPFVGKDTIDQRVQQVRNDGGNLRELLLAYCLPVIFWYGARLHESRFPILELVGVGNLALLEVMEKAIVHISPVGYLLKSAYGSMIEYRQHFQSIIALPSTPGTQPHEILFLLDNLDTDQFDIEEEPYVPEENTEDTAPLYHSIESLSPVRKQTICRVFGINGYTSESFADIAGSGSGTNRYATIRESKETACKRMRSYLLYHYPAFAQRHSREVAAVQKKYCEVSIPEGTKRKLEAAWQLLSTTGEQISMHKLRVASGVHTRYASAFLHLKSQQNS